MMDFDTWFESQYDTIRYEYEQDLIENGYAPFIVSETDDGRDERCKAQYNIYLTNGL